MLFRLLLAIPHLIWLSLWGIPAALAFLPQWLVTLVRGRPSERLFRFLAAYLRYATHVDAYVLVLANPFPHFRGRPGYPVDLVVDSASRQHRLKTAFRLVLVVPAYVFAYVLGTVMQIVLFFAWFACLVLGRIPRGMRDIGTYWLRYEQQTLAYLLLLTDRYPTIAAEPPRTELSQPPDGAGLTPVT